MPMPSFNLSNLPKKIPIVVAIISGILAVMLINTYLKQKEGRLASLIQKQKEQQVRVVVAKNDIGAGEVLEEKDVKMESVPASGVQPRVVKYISAVVGKVASIDIAKGEQILSNKIRLSGEGTSLAMKTPAGKRAITLLIDNISAVGGMVEPGDYVDVIGLVPIPVQAPDGKQVVQNTTMPLFQNVLILAIGGQTSRGSRTTTQANPPITLALSPEEATLISFVHEQGKIRLVLRSPADSQVKKIPPASWDTVLQHVYPDLLQKAQEQAVKAAPKKQVEIYRGLNKETIALKGAR